MGQAESTAEGRLQEIAPLISNLATQLDAVAVAIAIEDGWGITLADEDISPRRLGTIEGVRAVLRQYGEGP